MKPGIALFTWNVNMGRNEQQSMRIMPKKDSGPRKDNNYPVKNVHLESKYVSYSAHLDLQFLSVAVINNNLS